MSSCTALSCDSRNQDGQNEIQKDTNSLPTSRQERLETILLSHMNLDAKDTQEISSTLERFLQQRESEWPSLSSRKTPAENDETNANKQNARTIVQLVLQAWQELCRIESTTEKLAGRKALEAAGRQLLLRTTTTSSSTSTSPTGSSLDNDNLAATATSSSDPRITATLLVGIALAMNGSEDTDAQKKPSRTNHRSIASALSATLTEYCKNNNIPESKEGPVSSSHAIFEGIFSEVVPHNDKDGGDRHGMDGTDWHIIAGLSKAVNVDCLDDNPMANNVSMVLSNLLHLDSFIDKSRAGNNNYGNGDGDADDDDKSTTSSMDYPLLVSKVDAAAALALAAQLQPWSYIAPELLVNVAITCDLWHAAERICDATTTTSSPPSSGTTDGATSLDVKDAAVEALMEGAFESKNYRQADTYATKFYSFGGKYRYLEARYLHACSTITKVIQKGAIPIIDKQVDRVDKAVNTIRDDAAASSSASLINPESACDDIRNFALQQLQESGNADAAHRLAGLWGMDYFYDEEAVLAAAKARREKYLQWEDLVPGSPPDLISSPGVLISAITDFCDGETKRGNASDVGESDKLHGTYGFDVEWNENDAGADLLQLASAKGVLLLDIPALSATPEGVDALRKTVGRLFASCTMVGFSCRQDIAKLRSSRTCYHKRKEPESEQTMHWFSTCHDVVDLQALVSEADASLGRLGLSRVCERYLGKPLDKSEQCSYWNARPLSLNQRIYAALDAWTVKVVYEKLAANPYDDNHR